MAALLKRMMTIMIMAVVLTTKAMNHVNTDDDDDDDVNDVDDNYTVFFSYRQLIYTLQSSLLLSSSWGGKPSGSTSIANSVNEALKYR